MSKNQTVLGRPRGSAVAARLLALAVASSALACAGSDADDTSQATVDSLTDQTALDVNDVSILYPVATNAADAQKLIPLSLRFGGDDGATILPDVHFRALADISTKQDDVGALRLNSSLVAQLRDHSFNASDASNYEQHPGPKLNLGVFNGGSRDAFKIVAIRFVPCNRASFHGGAPMSATSACNPQLRFVAQPFVNDTALDAAFHVIYDFPVSAGPALAKDFLAIKSPVTTGMPLGVHPLLAKEGPGGAFSQALQGLLVRNLPHGTLAAVAGLGVRDSNDQWTFLGSLVIKGGLFVAGQKFGDSFFPFQEFTRLVRPAQMRPSDPREETDSDDFLAATLNPQRSSLLLQSQESQENRTCAGCHRADALVGMRFKNDGTSNVSALKKLFTNSNSYAPPTAVTAFATADALQLGDTNLHAFGIHDRRPSVSMRVVQETAEAVDYANRVLLGAPANPAPQTCDVAGVWACHFAEETGCFARNCRNSSVTEKIGRADISESDKPDRDFSSRCTLTHFLTADNERLAMKANAVLQFTGDPSTRTAATIRVPIAILDANLSCFTHNGSEQCLVIGDAEGRSSVGGPVVASLSSQLLLSKLTVQKDAGGTSWRTGKMEFQATHFADVCKAP